MPPGAVKTTAIEANGPLTIRLQAGNRQGIKADEFTTPTDPVDVYFLQIVGVSFFINF